MKEIFIKNKIVIFRVLGILMLVIGFTIFFWATPKEGLSEYEIAAENVARMEARVAREIGASTKASKPDSSKFIEELKNTQAKQMQYLTIMSMILGVGFLGYSFIGKSKSDSEQ